MNPHVTDDLSAYIDGELSVERTHTVDTHVNTCADCRGLLDALRATSIELRALPEPIPPEQDSWALRAAIVKAKGKGARTARWSIAAGGVAASLAAILALSLGGSQRTTDSALRPEANTLQQAAVTPVVLDENFDTVSARRLLEGADFTANESQGTARGGAAPLPAAAPKATADALTFAPQIARCEQQIYSGSTESHTALSYYVATYGKTKTPAFLLVYRLPGRRELWVLRQSDCYLLLFRQA